MLRGAPVFDAYLLDAKGEVDSAVRVFPGRFDPAGLGEKATYSAAGNLAAVVEAVREKSGRFSLHTDFGLAHLPGCQLKRAADGSDYERENLLSLTRYGWLMVDLQRQDPAAPPSPAPSPQLTPAATALTAAAPVVGAAVAEAVLPRASAGSAADAKSTAKPASPGLPPPPENAAGKEPWPLWRIVLGGTLAALFILSFFFSKQQLLGTFVRLGVDTGALPALLAAGCFLAGFHYLSLKRQVLNTPTSRIRSMAMGMVEVRGKAERLYAVVSPMSQMACVYYRLHRYRRDRNNSWQLTSTTSSGHVPFALQDETGRVTIDPKGAAVHPHTRQEGFPGGSTMFFSGDHMGNSNEKWVEEIIAEGTSLYILGFARSRRIPGASLEERTVATLRRYKEDPQAMRRFDTDGDGQISAEEWDAAREAAEEEALAESLTDQDRPHRQEEQVVVGRPESRSLPFVIAETASEARLSRNFGLLGWPLLATGGVLAIGAAVLFLSHFYGL